MEIHKLIEKIVNQNQKTYENWGGKRGSKHCSLEWVGSDAGAVTRYLVLLDTWIHVKKEKNDYPAHLSGPAHIYRAPREATVEVGEGGVAVNDDDASIAADVCEGLVVGEWWRVVGPPWRKLNRWKK
ncbi:HTH-type transcriptional regulator BetI [Striga asiatica]|uniref:HTH-type transcriptional regulator BetI n=1 Tax=Striga asiatica TaxID=4170 RepID=A0A5A7PKM4_STRAF|nr:HTH-type transcriptional regulator BetI [Striga asiatica]